MFLPRLPKLGAKFGCNKGGKKKLLERSVLLFSALVFWLGRSIDAPGSLPSTLIPLRSAQPQTAHSRPPWDFQAPNRSSRLGAPPARATPPGSTMQRAPGQRMLAQMGWSAGQSLGLTMPGLTENLKVAYKMDNKGIGAQRHEREARANGKDIWVGGGGDLGSLFERLNAANAASASTSAAASSPSSEAESDVDKRSKKSKKDSKVKSDKKEKKAKKERKDEASDDKSKKKRGKGIRFEEEQAILKRGQGGSCCSSRRDHAGSGSRATGQVSAPRQVPARQAHGVPPRTSRASMRFWASPRLHPLPQQRKRDRLDRCRPAALEAEKDAQSESESSSDEEDVKQKKKKSKKDKKDKKDKDEKKKSKKRKAGAAVEEEPASASQGSAEAAAAEAAAAEEKEKSTQIGTNSQGLFVFEYLNRRLMIRKAQIAKQKKGRAGGHLCARRSRWRLASCNRRTSSPCTLYPRLCITFVCTPLSMAVCDVSGCVRAR
ncbi:hypothetical protein L1887_42369 [Cichorium endivia]|nr:hypothetical protein L1887_42369 [Cichorium endivia]